MHYNSLVFIENDPIFIPHQFSKKEDIEISGFFAATLAWGIRKAIINNGTKLMLLMDNTPYAFVTGADKSDLKVFKKFVHRTFNGTDCIQFIELLKRIYCDEGGLEKVFTDGLNQIPEQKIIQAGQYSQPLAYSIHYFRKKFLFDLIDTRIKKHVADPMTNSTTKRICMYLRWMVRNDKQGVDFGLWKNISPSLLHCPLDVHSGRVARELGLLKRSQNDWKAVVELTDNLKLFDASDPVKYDFALFGSGVENK
jgi:uncharacterized protein (TIGR02757 family)